MGRPKYRKHCMWCGERTSEFTWQMRKLRRVKVYGHKEHDGNWEMLKRRQKTDVDRVSVEIQEMLCRPSPWIDILITKK